MSATAVVPQQFCIASTKGGVGPRCHRHVLPESNFCKQHAGMNALGNNVKIAPAGAPTGTAGTAGAPTDVGAGVAPLGRMDPARLTTSRGGYPLKELRVLAQLHGLDASRPKAELVGLLKRVAGVEETPG